MQKTVGGYIPDFPHRGPFTPDSTLARLQGAHTKAVQTFKEFGAKGE